MNHSRQRIYCLHLNMLLQQRRRLTDLQTLKCPNPLHLLFPATLVSPCCRLQSVSPATSQIITLMCFRGSAGMFFAMVLSQPPRLSPLLSTKSVVSFKRRQEISRSWDKHHFKKFTLSITASWVVTLLERDSQPTKAQKTARQTFDKSLLHTSPQAQYFGFIMAYYKGICCNTHIPPRECGVRALFRCYKFMLVLELVVKKVAKLKHLELQIPPYGTTVTLPCCYKMLWIMRVEPVETCTTILCADAHSYWLQTIASSLLTLTQPHTTHLCQYLLLHYWNFQRSQRWPLTPLKLYNWL